MLDRHQAAGLIAAEMTHYWAARRAGDHPAAWRALERAHIVAQPYFGFHLSSHGHMLGFAVALGDWREAAGQIFRLTLVPLGSLTGRLPAGNSGRARVSAFKPMTIPPDLAAAMSRRHKQAKGR